MKNKSILTVLSLCLGLGMATTSCEDMLTPNSDRHSYTVAGDTLYSYWGILKSLQNLGERYVILGECRGELIDGGEFTTDSVNALLTFGLNGDIENIKDGANRYLKVSDYYHVINSCNEYLRQVDLTKNTATGDGYMHKEWAQVQAIRAWVYMQLVANYGDVPFYDENTPMNSTEDIEDFYEKLTKENGSSYRVNSETLWQKLEDGMKAAFAIEDQWGYPSYEHYGYTTGICHATKAMFPTAVVLADLYLMGNQYEKAAEYYYEFLEGKYGGVLPSLYYSYAFIRQGETTPTLNVTTVPWDEIGAVSRNLESITAIPSSNNAQWGTVQRGVNELFGFDLTISQVTNDTTTSANISLSQNWERQLGPSAGYDDMRLAQKFEVYQVAEATDITTSTARLVTLEGVGDARGVSGQSGSGFISRYNSGDYYIDETQTQRYIMKQNPDQTYSTVYPMVYRKSMIWLRFAEAINRAGYPSYAFAILKDGLTYSDIWVPEKENSSGNEWIPKDIRLATNITIPAADVDGEPTVITYPTDWSENDRAIITNLLYDSGDEAIERVKDYYSYVYSLVNAEHPEVFDEIGDDEEAIYNFLEENTEIKEVISRGNYLADGTSVICDYIDLREVERRPEWLDFNKSQFAGYSGQPIGWIKSYPMEANTLYSTYRVTTSSNTNYSSRGIHQKGCGLLLPGENRGWYNYVDQINRKYQEAHPGTTRVFSKNEIYDGTVDQKTLQEAIEDLILEEEGLELAFEGSRFFDIMRVAKRRDNPGEYMKNIIKKRNPNTNWADGLLNQKNWYLPLPDGSNRPITSSN